MKTSVAIAAACATLALGTAAAAATPVNPVTSPITIAVQSSALTPSTVRVTRVSDGVVVATLAPVTTSPTLTTTTLIWNGGRGTGGTAQLLPDGDYSLDASLGDGTVVPVTPALVTIDATVPNVVLRPKAPTVPYVAPKGIPLKTDPTAQVRAIVRRPGPDGEVLASGAWKPVTDTLQLPAVLRANRIMGLVSVTAEARDAAGNTGTSKAVLWSVQPPGRGAAVVTRVATNKPLVAVTIDDGYGPSEAMRMIQDARSAGVTITFCFNAINQRMWGQDFREAVAKAVEDGVLEVCSHGYSHTTGVGTTEAFGRSDLVRNAPWDRLAGYSTAPFYRPPFGAYGSGLRAAAANLGYRYIVLWDVDTNDWKGPPSASVITQRAVGGARKGSIILMHTKPNSAAAFPAILSGLKAKGLRPVGLSELFSAGRPS
jgi:peptidoglycan/xylan/chitin deacetylase (PgdA/CDA1 family)